MQLSLYILLKDISYVDTQISGCAFIAAAMYTDSPLWVKKLNWVNLDDMFEYALTHKGNKPETQVQKLQIYRWRITTCQPMLCA